MSQWAVPTRWQAGNIWNELIKQLLVVELREGMSFSQRGRMAESTRDSAPVASSCLGGHDRKSLAFRAVERSGTQGPATECRHDCQKFARNPKKKAA